MDGRTRYETGKAAEEQVAQLYLREGYTLMARRWRGPAGELDLVFARGDEVVFVEVKASRDFARAALSLTQRQMKRICASAAHFLGFTDGGSLTPMRFDVALVDRSGQIDRLAGAFGV